MAPSHLRPAAARDWSELRALAYAEASGVLRDPERADDAAQEATLRAWRKAHRIREPESLRAWVRTIARREALRLAARQREVVGLPDEPAEPSAEHDIVGGVDVRRALGELEALDRRLVVERYWRDHTCAEIARALEMPEGTVKVRLHRARAKLREALA